MLQTQDGFRVAEVQAVENLLNGADWNEEMVYATFKQAKVQPDYVSAEHLAKKIAENTKLTPGWVELAFGDRIFPTSESPEKELPKMPRICW
jgi:hypothetical protein